MRTIAGYTIADTLTDPTPNQTRANEIRRQLQLDVDRIRSDQNTSDEGKLRLIAKLYVPASEELERLDQQEQATYATALAATERTVVGIDTTDPNALIAYRDAADRAEAIPLATTEAGRKGAIARAEELLRRAELSGDTYLAKAVLMIGLQRGSTDVVDAFRAKFPADAGAVDDYFELRRHDPAKSANAAYAYQRISVPGIGGLGLERLRELAAGAAVYERPQALQTSDPRITDDMRRQWKVTEAKAKDRRW